MGSVNKRSLVVEAVFSVEESRGRGCVFNSDPVVLLTEVDRTDWLAD